MAVCIGCGLEVNNGILEVNVCGDPVIPNITTGGLQCDPNTEDGCLKVVLNDTHAGCGLNAVQGQLVVDPCDKGGILCGATDDDAEDNCIYVDLVGQHAGKCIQINPAVNGVCTPPGVASGSFTNSDGNGNEVVASYGLVQNPDLYGAQPADCDFNCNGLMRTCDGLWAPPPIASINFSCGQIAEFARVPITNLLFPIGDQAGLVAGSSDGFPGYSNDMVFGTSAGQQMIINSFCMDECVPIDAMSWTAFTINFELPGGELWRFGLHERICNNAGAVGNDALNQHCAGGWALQSVQYIDTRGNATNVINVGSVQINDNSTWRFGREGTADCWRMEAMITAQRLVGTTALNSHFSVAADFQYRNMGHGFHFLATPQYCIKSGAASNTSGGGPA